MKRIQQIMMVVLLGLIASCAHLSTPMDEVAAKKVVPEQGKALVIVYWDELVMPNAWPVFLLDGKQVVNVIERGHKVYYQAKPGKHTLALGRDNLIPFSGYDFKFVDADLEAGKVYYIAVNAYRNTGLIDAMTGVHIKVHNPTFQDGKEAAAKMQFYLKRNTLSVIAPEGYQLFQHDEPDLWERYDEQLAEWKALSDDKRMPLRASLPTTQVETLNGKWM